MKSETSVILACDESGAKGYADIDEGAPGEIGVFAGVLLPEEQRSLVLPDFHSIQDQFKPATGKFHIADLGPADQEALRASIYNVIAKHQLPCFWYAVHVAGFHNWYEAEKVQLKQAAEAANPRFRHGSFRHDPASLHVELFAGLYSHLVAFLDERERTNVNLEIWTDRVDSPLLNKFEAVARRLLPDQKRVDAVTALDSVTKKLVTGQIVFEYNPPPEWELRPTVQSLAINLAPDEGIVLAADVLANSLSYHFSQRGAAELYGPLNTPQAIATHPLAHNLSAFRDWGNGDLFGDRLCRHPKAPITED